MNDDLSRCCFVCGLPFEKGDQMIVTAHKDDHPFAAGFSENGRALTLAHEACQGYMDGAELSEDAKRAMKRKFRGIAGS